MSKPTVESRVVVAPEELGLDSRMEFRRAAFEAIEVIEAGALKRGVLVIDFSSTRSVDSSGLGALIVVQRKAAESRIAIKLRGLSQELRFLLALTKLEDLFEIEMAEDM
ncbi:MAG: STAS domain-containing protein [Gemmatimonadales bacterium]